MARVWGLYYPLVGSAAGGLARIDGRGERHSVYLDPSAPHRVVLYLRAVGSVLVIIECPHRGPGCWLCVIPRDLAVRY